MKKLPLFILITVLLFWISSCNKPELSDDTSFTDRFLHLAKNEPTHAVLLADSLAEMGSVPFIEDETILFLYEGEAETIIWNGDFNRWGNGETYAGTRIRDSDWWFTTAQFPRDARLDYKIVRNDDEWMEDPLNDQRQLGGAGYNSVIKMPDWVDKSVEAAEENRGITYPERITTSEALGARVAYVVHETRDFDPSAKPYGVLIVTDGHEYAHPDMGNLFSQVDYLYEVGEIMPMVVIALDPRDPDSGENLRASHYVQQTNYLKFVGEELPELYTELFAGAERTAILGTSFGGFFATQLSRLYGSVYPHAIIQSPAYWPDPSIIIDEWKELEDTKDRRLVITYGTIHDGGELGAEFATIAEEKSELALRIVVNEGHSWGAWRNQLPEALIWVFVEY